MGALLGSTAAPSVPLQYLLKNIYLLDVTRYPLLSIRPNLHWKNRHFGLGPLIMLGNTNMFGMAHPFGLPAVPLVPPFVCLWAPLLLLVRPYNIF